VTLPLLAHEALQTAHARLNQAMHCWAAPASRHLPALNALAEADANLSMLLALAAQEAFAAGHPLHAIQQAARPVIDRHLPPPPPAAEAAGHHVPIEACVALADAEDALVAVARVWERCGPVAALDVLLGVVDQVEAAAGHAITAAAQLPTS